MIWSECLLRNKRILISGASSGIGKVCAIVCSQLGAQVIAMGRDVKRLSGTIDCLEGAGHTAIVCELTNVEQLNEKLSVLKSFQPVSGFIHCAGIERTNPLKSIEINDYSEMFRANVISIVQISRFLSTPKIYDKEGCSFVMLSSISGMYGEKGKIEYSSTKSALYGVVKSMAKELAGKGIRVNSISPAMVKTPMLESMFSTLPDESVKSIEERHLLGIPTPEDVANLCVFLISDLGKCITGSNIVIDSGYSLI